MHGKEKPRHWPFLTQVTPVRPDGSVVIIDASHINKCHFLITSKGDFGMKAICHTWQQLIFGMFLSTPGGGGQSFGNLRGLVNQDPATRCLAKHFISELGTPIVKGCRIRIRRTIPIHLLKRNFRGIANPAHVFE